MAAFFSRFLVAACSLQPYKSAAAKWRIGAVAVVVAPGVKPVSHLAKRRSSCLALERRWHHMPRSRRRRCRYRRIIISRRHPRGSTACRRGRAIAVYVCPAVKWLDDAAAPPMAAKNLNRAATAHRPTRLSRARRVKLCGRRLREAMVIVRVAPAGRRGTWRPWRGGDWWRNIVMRKLEA